MNSASAGPPGVALGAVITVPASSLCPVDEACEGGSPANVSFPEDFHPCHTDHSPEGARPSHPPQCAPGPVWVSMSRGSPLLGLAGLRAPPLRGSSVSLRWEAGPSG